MKEHQTKRAEPTERKSPVGGFEIVKLIRQYVPIEGDGIHSFGNLLDMQLEEAARAGQEVQTIKLEVGEEYWREFVARTNANEFPNREVG